MKTPEKTYLGKRLGTYENGLTLYECTDGKTLNSNDEYIRKDIYDKDVSDAAIIATVGTFTKEQVIELMKKSWNQGVDEQSSLDYGFASDELFYTWLEREKPFGSK